MKLKIGMKVVTEKRHEGTITSIEKSKEGEKLFNCGDFSIVESWIDKKATKRANMVYVNLDKPITYIENKKYYLGEYRNIFQIKDIKDDNVIVSVDLENCTLKQLNKIIQQFGFYCIK